MTAIQNSTIIGKNEDGSDITQDVDVQVWWRDVGRARCPRIPVMVRQFLAIPVATSATTERVFSFAGLTLSDLCKSLLEGTLETIMWWMSVLQTPSDHCFPNFERGLWFGIYNYFV
jgi:hypothetical protein